MNIAKTNMFCLVQHIQTYAQAIFPVYYADYMHMSDDSERFIYVFAKHYVNLNALHPYCEDNGQMQKEFSRELCVKCEYALDLKHTGHEEMISASMFLI